MTEALLQLTVLIVDDNLKNLQVLGGFLQKEGINIEFAVDGSSALSWLEKRPFDLILLDVMMPEMDGFEVCRRIKKMPERMEIPVIFLTAKSDPESIIKGFEAGAVDFIAKPFVHKELLARVKTHLQIQKSREEVIHYLGLLEEQNLSIRQSIDYARKIQNAVMSESKKNLAFLNEYFVFYQPKDVLSGDFYWLTRKDDKLILTVMDCTGHGIPGALMSILGITLLNEIINQKGITRPDLILDQLRTGLINNLGQKLSNTNVRDGIEGGVVALDEKKGMIYYAGSFNPLLLIQDKKHKIIKGDRVPVGIHDITKTFSLFEYEYNKGDLLYLFTDGILDQFGGPDNKRFMIKRLVEHFLRHENLSMEEQKGSLIKELKSWQGNCIQTDDILILGMRL